MAKKRSENVEISKKTLIITAVIVILVIVGLLALYLYSSGKLDKIFGKPVTTEISSELEAAEKLTDVAGDISSLKEDLNSITRGVSGP